MVKMPPPADGHRATNRVLDVIERLAATGETTTLAAMSAHFKVPKSSLLPLLRTIVARGWIEQPRPGSYRIAADRLPGRNWTVRRVELPQVARPFLSRLTADTGETSFVGVLPPGGDAVVYIEKVESPHSIRYSAELGERRPMHCTAIGMAVLAFLPDELRTSLLRKTHLGAYTEHTDTDRTVLERRLRRIVKAGVAVTFEEFAMGAGAIAAPIFNRRGEVAGACTLAGPIDRMRAKCDRYAEAVKTTAFGISAALGWRPQTLGDDARD